MFVFVLLLAVLCFFFFVFAFFWLISLGRGMCIMGSVEDISKESVVPVHYARVSGIKLGLLPLVANAFLYLLSHPADSTWSFLNKISSETLILGREKLTLHIETPMKYVHLVKVKIYRSFKKQIKERASSNQC